MKTFYKVCKTAICAITCVALLTACGNAPITESGVGVTESVIGSMEDNSTNGTAIPEFESTGPIEINVIEDYVIDDSLLGMWTLEQDDITYMYTFNEDNTGEFIISDDAQEIVSSFTYSSDSNELQIQFEDFVSTDIYAYQIADDTLTLDDNFGNVLELTRTAE